MDNMDNMDKKISRIYKRKKFITGTLMVYLLLGLGTIIMIAPFIWMISTSLKEPSAVFTFPPEFIPRIQLVTKYSNSNYPLFTALINGKKEKVIKIKRFKDDVDLMIYKDGKVIEKIITVTVPNFKPVMSQEMVSYNNKEYGLFTTTIKGDELKIIIINPLEDKAEVMVYENNKIIEKIKTIKTIDLKPIEKLRVEVSYNNKKYGLYSTVLNSNEEKMIKFKETKTYYDIMLYKNDKIIKKVINIPKVNLRPLKKIKFLWRNYIDAWTAVPFGMFFINSIFVAICVTFGQVFTSSLAAYAFARLNFPGRDKLFLGYLATMMIPGTVTMIPVFILLKSLGWLDTYQALIMPAMFSAYGTFLLRQFFLSIPKDLEESAIIDGASKFKIYLYIILPLSKPALATITTFTFLGSWNNFMWPLIVITSLKMKTLPIGLASFQGLYETNWTLLMAASVLVLIPVIIVYIFNQRFFVKGIVLSGLKA